MKPSQPKIRSVFTSGTNLGGRVHKVKKGMGSYIRKNRYNRWEQ